jgi:hypothetical protein
MKNFDSLRSLVTIADVHVNRLEIALHHNAHLLPFQPAQLQSLTDAELGYLEMLTARFAKLQDFLNAKVFPAYLELVGVGQDQDSGIDRLHKLEKLGLLSDSKEWVAMRMLRNHITHEYPDNPELMASNLNQTVAYTKNLIIFWHHLKPKIEAELQRL